MKTAPQIYSKYVTIEDGKMVLYVKLQKTLYGCLQSALLFYKKLVGNLKSIGFVVNLYNPCVANKTMGGRQFTITWHVDDLKLSHVNKHEVTKIIERLKSLYGEGIRLS